MTEMSGECMNFTGARNKDGYGHIRQDGRLWRAHVLVFQLAHGATSSPVIRHKCDNRSCINPAHLVAGTQKQNMADMFQRGRAPQAKLTPDQIDEICRLYLPRDPQHSARALAKRFGVTHTAIAKAIARNGS